MATALSQARQINLMDDMRMLGSRLEGFSTRVRRWGIRAIAQRVALAQSSWPTALPNNDVGGTSCEDCDSG